MKFFGSIALVLVALTGFAQTDSVRVTDGARTAPESLHKLVEELNATKAESVSQDADIEIDGLLFDETKTKTGRDFYDIFYSIWEAPLSSKNYSIFINEKPYRVSTTRIEVKINETLVFQSFLQPRGDIVELLAEQAVSRTYLYLKNYEDIIRQLDGEDRAGSGIY